jgi:hypothetical protein
MGAVQTATFESVWAVLQEVAASQAETDRLIKETRESQKETDRIVRENAKQQDKQIGKLGKRMGEAIEYMVAPNLRQKLRDLGLTFPSVNIDSDVADFDNDIFFEIDVKLENGDKAMLVEVKTKPSTEDVQEHIDRLEKMRKYADLHGDKRTFLGLLQAW